MTNEATIELLEDRESSNPNRKKITIQSVEGDWGAGTILYADVERNDSAVKEGSIINAGTFNSILTTIKNANEDFTDRINKNDERIEAIIEGLELSNSTDIAESLKENKESLLYSIASVKTTADDAREKSIGACANAGQAVEKATRAEQLANEAKGSASIASQLAAQITGYGIFSISANAQISEINAIIEAASNWGATNKVRATMKILGVLGNTNPEEIIFKSNVNYSFQLETNYSGVVLDGVSNCGLRDCYISSVGTNGLRIKNCENVDVVNCTIINQMSNNVVENSTGIYFENCTLKGGTYLNKTVSIVDTETAKNTVTYANCKFDNTYATLIDASGVSNSNSVITLMNCVDANLSPIVTTQVVKGGGSMRSLSATQL